MSLLALMPMSATADWLDDAGMVELLDYIGASVSLADFTSGITVAQIEAGTNYLPFAYSATSTPTSGNYSNILFTDQSGSSAARSGHAASVATDFYSQSTSYATGVSSVDNYSVTGFLDVQLDVLSDTGQYEETGVQLTPLAGKVASQAWISTSILPPAIHKYCLLYTSPSPRDGATSRMPSSA